VGRISWDQYFSELACLVAKRTSCIRRAVGAVIVSKDNCILSTGYNGSPRGMVNCCDVPYKVMAPPELGPGLLTRYGVCRRAELGYASGEGMQFCFASHAEQNAIAQAARKGQAIEGAIMYVTHQPCTDCTKLIIAAGISEVVFLNDYAHTETLHTLEEGGVKHRRYIQND